MPTTPDNFDPDDNFAQSFSPEGEDLDEDAALEAVVWQLLLLINPGDEDAALQQFSAVRESLAEGGDVTEIIRDTIDWKAGFHIADDDPAGVIEAIDELAARFGVRVDWDIDDTSDEDELADTDATALLQRAGEQLREHHYTLWTWETGADTHAGWITLQRDDEALPVVAGALGFHVRPAAL